VGKGWSEQENALENALEIDHMLIVYNVVLMIAITILMPLVVAALIQTKRKAVFRHRLGWTIGEHAAFSTPGRVTGAIWIHALSVGEVASAEPIVNLLRRHHPQWRLVFSATTRTGMDTARRLFEDKVEALFYFPYDFFFSVRRTVRQVRPRMVIIVETDLWPNFLMYLKKRRIPALLVNARLSASSFRGYRLLGALGRRVLDGFCFIGAQSEQDAVRFMGIGAPPERVVVTGNVKFGQSQRLAPDAQGLALRRTLGLDVSRRIVVLGSTHPGEEKAGLEAFLGLKMRFEDVMLVVAPRDPLRAEEIAQTYRTAGLKTHLLPALEFNTAHQACDALIVNTIGILRRLYAVADIVFVGGSLVAEGGHNPLEPACLAKPILFGPHTSDFESLYRQLVAAAAAVQVRSAQDLLSVSAALFADAPERTKMGRNALKVFLAGEGAVRKTVDLIRQCLAQEV
jgi:3-deoxy-D-manno-octulosonic-acid transferase